MDGSLILKKRHLPTFEQRDGILRVLEFAHVPGYPARWFRILRATGHVRGEHAHRICSQVFLPVPGHARLCVSTPTGEAIEFVLDEFGPAIEVPPWRWVRIVDITPGTTLDVLASRPYDPTDYIHDWAEFRRGPPGRTRTP